MTAVPPRAGRRQPQRRPAPRRNPPRMTRATQAAARRRHQQLWAGVAIAVAVVVIVALIGIKLAGGFGGSGNTRSAGSAEITRVVNTMAAVPAATLASASKTTKVSLSPFYPAVGGPITKNGKPEVLYMGAEYCPFCAAERWGMVMALSKFGTFSNLGQIHSSSTDVYPNTPTFSFYGSTYTSKYLTFTSVEELTVDKKALQTATAAENSSFEKNESTVLSSSEMSQGGSIPFVNMGGKKMLIGATYSPQVLAGMSFSQVGQQLKNPASDVAVNIEGTAGKITNVLCQLTHDQPANVCSAFKA